MLYCYNDRVQPPGLPCRPTSTTRTITIIPAQGHPPASIAPSILRMSALERLAVAAVLIAVIWGAVIWAMA